MTEFIQEYTQGIVAFVVALLCMVIVSLVRDRSREAARFAERVDRDMSPEALEFERLSIVHKHMPMIWVFILVITLFDLYLFYAEKEGTEVLTPLVFGLSGTVISSFSAVYSKMFGADAGKKGKKGDKRCENCGCDIEV